MSVTESGATRLQKTSILSNPFQAFKKEEHFTLLRLPINEVFNVIKDQPWVKRPRLIQY